MLCIISDATEVEQIIARNGFLGFQEIDAYLPRLDDFLDARYFRQLRISQRLTTFTVGITNVTNFASPFVDAYNGNGA